MNIIAQTLADDKKQARGFGQNKFIALMDAKQKSKENQELYSVEQMSQAIRLKVRIEALFAGSPVYLNYRKTYISIKVEDASIADAMSTNADMLAVICKLSNVSLIANGNNLIFHIAKQ